jgi:hypothetical protein
MVILSVLFLLSIRKKSIVYKSKVMNLRNNSLKLVPRAVKTYTCPPAGFDTDDCSGAYDDAVASVGFTDPDTWDDVKADAQDAINAYIDACPTSSCQTDCFTLINGNTLGTAITAGALEDCELATVEITPALGTSVCTAEASNNEETCKTAYDALLSAADTKKTWVAGTVVSTLATYVTACKKTACSDACKPVISGVNVALPYTSLLLNLNGKCNPYPPPPPEGDSAFMTIGPNLNIFFIFLSLIGIEVITFF